MEPVTWVLGGIVLTMVSAGTGKFLGNRGKVSSSTCEERMGSYRELIEEKFKGVDEKLDNLETLVRNGGRDPDKTVQ